jgi:phosphoribosylformylglycinamidine cyclo-ligase
MYSTDKPYKKEVLDIIRATWSTPYVEVLEGGTYPVIHRKVNFPEIDHTDGIGTKGLYHWRMRTFHKAICDALAMNLNDLAMAQAIPYKMQCHLTLPDECGEVVVEIMRMLAHECKIRNIAITGGETSIQNTSQCMDISLTVSGFLRNDFSNRPRAGDIIVGISSNGLHSNGFTKVREVFGEDIIRPEFVRATRLYDEAVWQVASCFNIHGMVHITGGAYLKLKEVLRDVDARLFGFPTDHRYPIFREIYRKGISDEEMYKTFNCGIGFMFSLSSSSARSVAQIIPEAIIIGAVQTGSGNVLIRSQFSGALLKF